MKKPIQQSFVEFDLSRKRIASTRRASLILPNRSQKLRDRMIIYPQSTLSKIVFISNKEGNGFQRENIPLYDVPSHIKLEQMFSEINMKCFKHWQSVNQQMEGQPLQNYDVLHKILGYFVLLVTLVFIYARFHSDATYADVLAYLFMAIVTFAVLCGVFLIREKRIDINRDIQMTKTIKRQLIRLNQHQNHLYPEDPRFTWTCHKQCIWIACQFH